MLTNNICYVLKQYAAWLYRRLVHQLRLWLGHSSKQLIRSQGMTVLFGKRYTKIKKSRQ